MAAALSQVSVAPRLTQALPHPCPAGSCTNTATQHSAAPESHHQDWDRETESQPAQQNWKGRNLGPRGCTNINYVQTSTHGSQKEQGMTGFALVEVLLLGKGEEEDLILELFSNLNNSTWNEVYPWQSWTFTPAGCMEAHNAWKQNAIYKTKDRSNWRNSFHITKPWVKAVTHPTAQVTDTLLQKGISEFSITSDSFFTKGNQLCFNFWVDG